MQNKDILLGGSRLLTGYDTSGNVDGQITIAESSRMAETVSSHSVNGDKRAPNPHDFSVKELYYPQGSISRYDTSNRLRSVEQGSLGRLYDFDFKVSDRTQSLYNSAVSEINKRARGELDLSVSALEYREVIRMVKGAGSIRSYVGNTIRAATKRGRPPSGETKMKAVVRDAGGNWLQWQLGLRPLLSDFYDTVKEVNTRVVLNMMRVRAKRSENIVVSEWSSNDSDVKAIGRPLLKGVQGVDIRVQFRPVEQFNALRYASLNPIGWAWELMPLSFVVDWFLNVGQTIRDSETALAYNNTFSSGYITYLTAYDGSISTKGDISTPGGRVSYDCHGRMRVVSFQRSVLRAWPFPSLPTFQSDLQAGQLLTAAALLSQQLRR